MRTQIVPASPCHITRLACEMRQADRDELACSGNTPIQGLWASYMLSDPDMRWTCLLDGRPIAMFGAAYHMDESAAAWLLTADGFDDAKREVWAHSVHYVEVMHSRYPILFNAVDDRNVVSRRWLRRLGFTEGAPLLVGGMPHHYYVSDRHV